MLSSLAVGNCAEDPRSGTDFTVAVTSARYFQRFGSVDGKCLI